MHVPGPVLKARDVSCLRDVGEQRVVAGMFPVMGIEAAEGPLDLRARADDGAVDVDRQPREAARGQAFDDKIVIEFHERHERRLRELFEAIAQRASGGEARQASEPRDERIPDQILQMLQAARADVEQPEQQQREARTAVVTRELSQRATQTGDDLQFPEVATEEFKAAVRREALRDELDVQVTLDCPPQAPYFQAHQRGLLESTDDVGASLHSMRGIAPLMDFACGSPRSRISDQG